MDEIDRRIVNSLQGGIEPAERPFLAVAAQLRIDEVDLIGRLGNLLREGTLTRFGPMYNADRFGGAFTLAAVSVPEDDFERVADLVNRTPEVAHNYRRDHEFNMWFVIAAERPERIDEVLRDIESNAGYRILNLPKLEEYFIGLRLEAE